MIRVCRTPTREICTGSPLGGGIRAREARAARDVRRLLGKACDAASRCEKGVPEVPLSPETWEKLQYLARLELSAEERVRMEHELEELLAFASALRQLPLDGVSPMILPVEVEPVLRADVPEEFPSREELFRSAPEVQDGSFVVPNVLEE
ncbi:MAG: Asp-tRNA(Asn)/Glu-tRNA(Gln) amidotransferase subunit GatC [Brockia lithotrophica]|nr:Asp-tRNA(Asn)/Glu-tRNA(Gln) amidotransferase subunit GatC [Brockia lithotrophica]